MMDETPFLILIPFNFYKKLIMTLMTKISLILWNGLTTQVIVGAHLLELVYIRNTPHSAIIIPSKAFVAISNGSIYEIELLPHDHEMHQKWPSNEI